MAWWVTSLIPRLAPHFLTVGNEAEHTQCVVCKVSCTVHSILQIADDEKIDSLQLEVLG